MRFPNGYGSVIKLSGKRRKPYAVRITDGYELTGSADNPRVIQKFRYLEYFEKKKDATIYLANYNAGARVKEHRNLAETPTLAEVYERWVEERERRTGLSESLRKAYSAAFAKYSPLHKKRIKNIRLADIQPILDVHSGMSRGTISNMLTVIRGIYHYAMRYELVEADFTPFLIGVGKPSKKIHKAFTGAEIEALWALCDDPMAQYALVLIYSGMRPVEPTKIAPEAVHLYDRYMIGGVKTAAGRDRVIPIHTKILPLIEARMDRKHLFDPVRSDEFKKWMLEHGMEHLPHDGRHTCATLMEGAGVSLHRRKLILGHYIKDITEGVYTHVSASDLVAEIDKIEV